jgi:hypothetical protein
VHFVGQRILGFGIALEDNAQQAIAGDHFVDQFGALDSLDEQWGYHAWKNHDIGQTQDWERIRQRT